MLQRINFLAVTNDTLILHTQYMLDDRQALRYHPDFGKHAPLLLFSRLNALSRRGTVLLYAYEMSGRPMRIYESQQYV